MTEPVRILDYNRESTRLFEDRARAIRTETGDVAQRELLKLVSAVVARKLP